MEVGTFHVSEEALLAAAQSGLREGRQSPEGHLEGDKERSQAANSFPDGPWDTLNAQQRN